MSIQSISYCRAGDITVLCSIISCALQARSLLIQNAFCRMEVSEITYTCIFHILTTMMGIHRSFFFNRNLCQQLVLALPAAVFFFFNFLQVHPLLNLLQDGQCSIFLGVKHLGHGIDNPSQYTVEVKNEDTYSSVPHSMPAFHVMGRHGETFTSSCYLLFECIQISMYFDEERNRNPNMHKKY